jgi:hypothetical protein
MHHGGLSVSPGLVVGVVVVVGVVGVGMGMGMEWCCVALATVMIATIWVAGAWVYVGRLAG